MSATSEAQQQPVPVASDRPLQVLLSAGRYSSQMLGMDYGLRSAPTMAAAIKHFSEDRLCQA